MKVLSGDTWEYIQQKMNFYMSLYVDQLSENPNAFTVRVSAESLHELADIVLDKDTMDTYDKHLTENRIANLESMYHNIDQMLGKKAANKIREESK